MARQKKREGKTAAQGVETPSAAADAGFINQNSRIAMARIINAGADGQAGAFLPAKGHAKLNPRGDAQRARSFVANIEHEALGGKTLGQAFIEGVIGSVGRYARGEAELVDMPIIKQMFPLVFGIPRPPKNEEPDNNSGRISRIVVEYANTLAPEQQKAVQTVLDGSAVPKGEDDETME